MELRQDRCFLALEVKKEPPDGFPSGRAALVLSAILLLCGHFRSGFENGIS
jgi:hypothetical protein